MNYPGSGESTDGTPRLKRAAEEALFVFDHVNLLAKGRPVFVHAGSFGTAMGLCVAAEAAGGGDGVAESAAAEAVDSGEVWLVEFVADRGAGGDADSGGIGFGGRVRKAKARAVFVLAGRDSLVTPEYQEKVVEAYAGEKRVISMPGAGHDDPLTKEAAEEFANGLEWLWETARR